MQRTTLAVLALTLSPTAFAQESPPLFELRCPAPAQILRAVGTLPSFERLEAAGLTGGGERPDRALERLEEQFGASLETLITSLADGGLELRVDLTRLQPTFCLSTLASDPIEARARLQLILARALQASGAPVTPGDLRELHDGVEWWALGDELTVGFSSGRTVVSNRRAAAEDRLDQPLKFGATASDLSATLDLDRLRRLSALGGDRELLELAQLGSNPEASFGLGASLASFGAAHRLSLELDLDPNGVDLALVAEGEEVVASRAAQVAPSLPAHPEDLVRLRLHRDLSEFVARTEALADGRSARLARQLGQLEVLFNGLELRREVLPAFGDDWQVVVREIAFTASPEPDLALPAAALVVPLADASLREPLVATFQNLIALSNVEAVQKGAPSTFLLRLAQVRGDGALSAAHLVEPRPGEPIDTRYNLAPACAAVGDWLLLATHEELLLELIDTLPSGGAPTTAESGEQLTFDARLAAGLLERHAESIALLIALRRGLDERRVMDAITGLARTLAGLERIALSIDAVEQGARLRLTVGSGGRY